MKPKIITKQMEDKAKIVLKRQSQCQLVCGDGSGKTPKRHVDGCPFLSEQMEDWEKRGDITPYLCERYKSGNLDKDCDCILCKRDREIIYKSTFSEEWQKNLVSKLGKPSTVSEALDSQKQDLKKKIEEWIKDKFSECKQPPGHSCEYCSALHDVLEVLEIL